MKVSFFHNLPSGGALRALYDKMRVLKDRGVQIRLYTFSTSEQGFLEPPCFEYETLVEELDYTGPQRVRRYEEATLSVAAKINHDDSDLVYVDKCRYFGAPLLLQYLKKPSVHYSHEPLGLREYQSLTTHEDSLHRVRLWMRAAGQISPQRMIRKLFQLRERNTIKKADIKSIKSASLILTCSRFVSEWLKRVYGIKTRVSYQGVDADFFKPGDFTLKSNQLMAVGRIEARKGYDFLIEVLSLLDAKKRPELIIVYDESDKVLEQALKRKAKRRAVHMTLMYRPSQTVLRQLYQSSQVLLCAGRNEPFGLSVLEGMACGTPVAALDEGGYRENVTPHETGYLLPRDPLVWAQTISEFLNNPSRGRVFAQNCRSVVIEKWKRERFADDFLKITERTHQPESLQKVGV